MEMIHLCMSIFLVVKFLSLSKQKIVDALTSKEIPKDQDAFLFSDHTQI